MKPTNVYELTTLHSTSLSTSLSERLITYVLFFKVGKNKLDLLNQFHPCKTLTLWCLVTVFFNVSGALRQGNNLWTELSKVTTSWSHHADDVKSSLMIHCDDFRRRVTGHNFLLSV